MANLKFCDTHNMVAYLQNPEGSEGFHQIVDFLNTSHIRYALTKNPTIYVSLIQQFWQTASASTLDNGEMKITATIDGKVKVVTKAYVRRNLKLEDSAGISNLPTTEIFKQLALMGVKDQQSPLSPITHPQMQDRAMVTLIRPHPPLLRVHTLRSDEGIMKHNELMDLVTKLSDIVVALETDLKQTKKVYGAAYTKLIMKVKNLKKTVKTSQARRRAKIVVSNDEEDLEESSKQGRKIDEIDQDPNISLIQHDAEIHGRYDQDMEFNLDFDAAKEVSTAEKEVSTNEPVFTAGATITTASVDVSHASPTRRVSTADDITMAGTLVYIRRSAAKDKGKSIMTESEPIQTKTKLQQEQERLGYEAAVKLQEEMDEEERQMMAEFMKQLNLLLMKNGKTS
nr:xylulose kinase-1 [Tanacetum cinerariifolium]